MTLLEQDDGLRDDTDLLPWVVIVPLFLRESGWARSVVDEAIDTARARAALGILPWLLNRVARDHAAADQWSRATVEYDEAVRLAHETGQRTELGAALAGWAWLEARQGREADCRAHAAEARALCVELGTHLFEIWAIRSLGELELGLGRASAAIGYLEDVNARLEAHGIQDVDLAPNAELIDAYLRVGRRTDADRLVRELDLEATRKGQPWSLARAARCRGLVATEREFEHHFDDAVELHGQTPDVFELGVTRLAYGGRLRRQRQRTRARNELRMALEIFEGLGAEPWAEMARGELLATGETARRRGASATDTLTRQELRIAQILAGGKTTRETAAALFLSPKTIEYHLRSIYGKLGMSKTPKRWRLPDLLETSAACWAERAVGHPVAGSPRARRCTHPRQLSAAGRWDLPPACLRGRDTRAPSAAAKRLLLAGSAVERRVTMLRAGLAREHNEFLGTHTLGVDVDDDFQPRLIQV